MQSRWMSFVEATINIVAGFGLAFITQIVVFPLFGIAVSTADNLLIGAIFTVVSLARSFALRRMFNHFSASRGA
jgi:cobalamin biosynthesis protein CobD/CbiB